MIADPRSEKVCHYENDHEAGYLFYFWLELAESKTIQMKNVEDCTNISQFKYEIISEFHIQFN